VALVHVPDVSFVAVAILKPTRIAPAVDPDPTVFVPTLTFA
jgi:hypothetical protein